MPLGHLGVNVADLARSKRFYDALAPALGYEPFLAHDDEFAYRPAGGKVGTFLFFYPAEAPGPYRRTAPGLQHLAFIVPTRSAVRAAHALALSLGAAEVHPPQAWPQYPGAYYAAFWLDPDGVMLEAVCHHDRD